MSDSELGEFNAQEDIRKALDLYAAGKPLFTRALLEDINRRMEAGDKRVKIKDYLDREHEYSFAIPDWAYFETGKTYFRISYHSVERLTDLAPGELDAFDMCPLTICYMQVSDCEKSTLGEIQDAYEKQQERWLNSETCRLLIEQLRKLTPAQSANITKVVGMGLGEVGVLRKDFERSIERALVQHSAIKTIVTVLEEQNGGRRVECYAQDPANNEMGDQFLKIVGITPLSDPKGFLEVDENTLVISANPNVPVRQILADIQWPTAMLWNTVEEEKRGEWEKVMIAGRPTWKSPHTTDPVSSRVLRMTEEYDELPFEDLNDWFGDMTLYVRRGV